MWIQIADEDRVTLFCSDGGPRWANIGVNWKDGEFFVSVAQTVGPKIVGIETTTLSSLDALKVQVKRLCNNYNTDPPDSSDWAWMELHIE